MKTSRRKSASFKILASFAYAMVSFFSNPRQYTATGLAQSNSKVDKIISSNAKVISSSKVLQQNDKGKKLPEAEQINRRKSPALWRYDLDNQEMESNSHKSTLFDLSATFPRSPPEVMAPAGGFPQLKAAIANGADSVYLGCSSFSARARAANFDFGELVEAVQFAHRSSVKVYVALNTLVFNHELEEVEQLIRQTRVAGVDALIIQDLGVAKIARKVAPDLEIHASTQQTVTSTDGVRHAADNGATRIVLGRELSIKEIASIAKDVDNDPMLRESGVEIETFVHGALCVSYSGQCFSSEAWGGRSANRGQCAQACRLPYGLVTDGALTELGDVQYLLSPQDLCGLDSVPQLVRAGVSCLKIEGRLKDEAYVAATTRAYRNAVDKAWADLQKDRVEAGLIDSDEAFASINRFARLLPSHETVTKSDLAQIFSRGQDEYNDGLSPGFFEGSRHQVLVRGRSPRHRGIHIGRISASSSPKRGLILMSENKDVLCNVKRGDGIVIDRGDPQNEELGGPLFEVGEVIATPDGRFSLTVRFGKDLMRRWAEHDGEASMQKSKRHLLVPEGSHVWKTSDAVVEKKLRKLAEAAAPRPLARVSVSGSVGEVLVVKIETSGGIQGIGVSNGVLEIGEKGGLMPENIQKAIGTLGNTEWRFNDAVDVSALQQGAWCPLSWVKEARRKAVADLERQNELASNSNGSPQRITAETISIESLLGEVADDGNYLSTTELSVLARTFEQVNALCEMIETGASIKEIIVDFLEFEGMQEAIERIRQVGNSSQIRAVVASPRVIKPGECGIWRTLLRLEADGLLIRSAGLLHRLKSLGGKGAKVNVASRSRGEQSYFVAIPELLGDFSLNAANAITAGELLSDGLSRITASYDLSASAITELANMLGSAGASKLEVVAHTHMPIFHTEHCVFARFLSNGNSYLDCGHACTRHNVHLLDQTGAHNLVLADMGCRNTVFTAHAQSGVHSIFDWQRAGIGTCRVELVDEGPHDTKTIVDGYLGVLAGSVRPSEVWESLKVVKDSNGNCGGVSLGSFKNSVERRAGEIV